MPERRELVTLAADLLRVLKHDRRRLAVAESCTGGLVGHLLTEVPGSSQVFLGGAITYDNHMKQQIGVNLITTRLGDEMHGMTANAVTSLSLDPMLVLVCVDKTADTHDILSKAGVFAVNILNQGQSAVSNRFAKKEFDGAHGLDDLPH